MNVEQTETLRYGLVDELVTELWAVIQRREYATPGERKRAIRAAITTILSDHAALASPAPSAGVGVEAFAARLRGRAGPFTALPGERYVDADIALDVLREALSQHPAAPSVSPAVAGDAGELVDAIIRDVAELPDRSSPEDWPEAMLVTGSELRRIIENRLATAEQPDTEGVPFCPRCGAHPDEQPGSAVQGEAVYQLRTADQPCWTDVDPDIFERYKARGGYEARILYTTPPPAPAAEQGEPSCGDGDALMRVYDGLMAEWESLGRSRTEGSHAADVYEWAQTIHYAARRLRANQPEARGVEEWDRLSMLSLAEGLRKRGDDLSVDSASWLEKIATPNPVRAEQPEGMGARVLAAQASLKAAGADLPSSVIRDAVHAALAAAPAAPAAPGAAVGVDEVRTIACALAREDGFDPDDKHGGLYDLRWSGGPTPEPLGDAWAMDYLPKAERIAAALAGKAQEESNGK